MIYVNAEAGRNCEVVRSFRIGHMFCEKIIGEKPCACVTNLNLLIINLLILVLNYD
jgi:hypothetical protein